MSDEGLRHEVREACAASRSADFQIISERRYRCGKGHVTLGPLYYRLGARAVQFCPDCLLDMVARECGPVEEVP